MINYIPHFDIWTLILYILMGIIGGLCIYYSKKRERLIGKQNQYTRQPYIIMFILWEIFAVGRYVTFMIGGYDARDYIEYFETCLSPYQTHFYKDHVEIGFAMFTKFIRLFTDDYHVYFFIIYGIIILSYILFIDAYMSKYASSIPLHILVLIYILGFSSIRTTLSASLILISLYFMRKQKKFLTFIFAILAIFTQRASVIYVGFYVFYYIYKKYKHKITLMNGVIWIILSYFAAKIFQDIILNGELFFLEGGAYSWYASQSIGTSFWDNAWKISFSQMLLALAIIICNKWINSYEKNLDKEDARSFYIVKLICYYDIILIPITYILNIWRGYEYFFIVRLIMWGYIIKIILKHTKENSKMIVNAMFYVVFLAWIIFRLYNMWEASSLMPYIFELFI